MLNKVKYIAYIVLVISHSLLGNQSKHREVLPAFKVLEQKTANKRPVTTFETPISNLDFDPRVDMQSRNMAEAQGDISIRGGTFENTGIQVGGAVLHDAQSGHYYTELPIAPEMLGEPRIFTGVENALNGFNSGVGTVSYTWSEMIDGGSITLGGGENDLNFQRLHHAITRSYEPNDLQWGVEFESSRSESDGTIDFGDHDFHRTTGRFQLLGQNSQTDLFAGYHHKVFSWPKLYTAPFGTYETENIKARLFILNHKLKYSSESFIESNLYSRRISDRYIYHASPADLYLSESKVYSLGLAGFHQIDENLGFGYKSQGTKDKMDSTSLRFGKFSEREYYKATILPQYRIDLNSNKSVTFKLGASIDYSNRNGSKFSPVGEIGFLRSDNSIDSEFWYISFAQSTQLASYSAIASDPSGFLFGGNQDLGREISKNLETGLKIKRDKWKIDSSVFYRWDDDLTDWTFEADNRNRKANPVDVETFGFELFASRKLDSLDTLASYTYLSKNEKYGSSSIKGSFYALNFPKHRATLGVIWNPTDVLQIRLDNEWREQYKNSIRSGPDHTVYTHLAASYYPKQIDELEIFMAYDKPWDEDFQDVPGTPGRGDQFSLGATYSW